MDPNRFILFLLNFVLFSVGVSAGVFFDIGFAPLDFGFSSVFAGIILVLGFFVLSGAFFGVISPVLFLYFGLLNSSVVFQNPVGLAAMTAAIVIATDAGSAMGEAAEKDLNQKAGFLLHGKTLFLRLVVALAAGVIAGYVFDLNISPENIFSYLEKLKTMANL